MTGRILQSGTHIARIVALKQPDGTYEAQVFVRLTREPEIAETYIPVGIYQTENEAWTAAEQRATRAIEEHEF
jgi:antitoxin (DNA-binding transcriptional repressor) of toxin-antitoxin stability system